jgi:hypothetical protein
MGCGMGWWIGYGYLVWVALVMTDTWSVSGGELRDRFSHEQCFIETA